jgi:hypothetical protein
VERRGTADAAVFADFGAARLFQLLAPMIALRIRAPRGADRPLALTPGHHTAGGSPTDTVFLEGLPASVLELEVSGGTATVVPRFGGVGLGARVLKAGERWLVRPGQSLLVRGFEIHRESEPGTPPPADGTGAVARSLLGKALGGAPCPSPLPSLVWLNGRDCGKRLPLLDEATFLGRGDGAAARVRDAAASRSHARIVLKAGEARLFDLESGNGLYVDGVKVEGSCALVGGEVIRLGETELLFEGALGRLAPPPPPEDGQAVQSPAPPASQEQKQPPPARIRTKVLEAAVIGAASAGGAALTAAVWLLAR